MAKGAMMERWFGLFMAIQGGRAQNTEVLARKVGVTKRTVYRDLKGMEAAGLPLYFDDKAGGYRLTDTFQMRPLQLTPEDLKTLVGALNFTRRTGPLSTRKRADALMDKLFAGLPSPTWIPAAFDLGEYLTGLWGITDGPETTVRLHFLPEVAQLALETRWHPTQESTSLPDGGALVTMTTRGPTELAGWLAGFGGHVVVEAPAELRAAMVALGQGLVAAHAEPASGAAVKGGPA